MALKYTKQINEDECIGDSLDTINASFSALDEGLQDVQDVVNNVEGAVENVLRQGDFVGNWITMPQNLTNSNVNYFLKYVGGSTVYKWQPDAAIYSTGTNVGIGTTSPSRKLHINTGGSSEPGLRIDSSVNYAGAEVLGLSGGYIRLTRKGTSRSYLVEITSTLSGTNLPDGVGVGGAINVLGDYFDIRTGSAVSNLSSLMFITPNGGGRIGIGGITNPLAKLDIASPTTGTTGGEVRLRGSTSSSYDFSIDTTDNQFRILRYSKGSSSGAETLFSTSAGGAVAISSSTSMDSLAVTNDMAARSATFTRSDKIISINTNTSIASLELGSNSGAYIDLKQPNSDDYDLRLGHISNTSVLTANGSLGITASEIVSVANTSFLANGTIGIGTNIPDTNIHVLSAGGAYLTLEAGAASNESNHPGVIFKQDGGIKRGFVGYFGSSSDRGDCLKLMSDREIVFATGASTNRTGYTNTAYASATTAMIVTSGGKVGIGNNIAESVILNKQATLSATEELKLMVDGGLWANDVRASTVSAAKIYFEIAASRHVDADFVTSGDTRTQILYLSGTNAFGPSAPNFSSSYDYMGYANNIASHHLSATYIAFGQAGSVNDVALLRQIGSSNNFHLALDLHDDHAGSNGQAFSIRNINSSQEAQSLLHIDTFGRTGFGTSTPTAKVQILGSAAHPALEITQTGSGHALLIQDSSGEPNPLIVTGSGTLLKGISASIAGAGGDVQISKHNGYSSLVMSSFSNDQSYHSGYLRFLRSKSGLSGRMGTNTGVKTDNTIGFIDFYADNNEGSWGQGTGVYAFADADWTSTSTPARLGFYTTAPGSNSWSERLRIASSGNVGIGTTTPAAKLHLRQTGNANAFMVDDVTTNTTPFVINKDGWVGVGTTTPAGMMHVNGSVITTGIITNSKATNLTLASGTTQDYSSSISLKGNSGNVTPQILFSVNNSDKMVLTSEGNLGIGNFTPEHKLHVTGTIQGSEIRATGPLYTATSDLQNNLLFTANQVNASWNDIANVRELALNFTTNGDTQFRDLKVYNGKRQPIIWANGATKKVTFYGDVDIKGALSAANINQSAPAPVVGDGVPVGTISYFAMDTPPPGWVACDGQILQNAQNVYPLLWSRINFNVDEAPTKNKRTWGRILGTSNIKLPDLRGEFIRGYAGGKTIPATGALARAGTTVPVDQDVGRLFGSTQDYDTRIKIGVLREGDGGGGSDHSYYAPQANNFTDDQLRKRMQASALHGYVDLGTETRPRNVALFPCIKVYNASEVEGPSVVIPTGGPSLSDFSNSKLENGWQKLPNGLILQWGNHTPAGNPTVGGAFAWDSGNTYANVKIDSYAPGVTFPISFPNAVLNIQLTEDIPALNNDLAVLGMRVRTKDKNGFRYGTREPVQYQMVPIRWFAIGY